jgi:hypothetical protein
VALVRRGGPYRSFKLCGRLDLLDLVDIDMAMESLMMFEWELFTCNEFNDNHDEVAVVNVVFIGRMLVYGWYLQGPNVRQCPAIDCL